MKSIAGSTKGSLSFTHSIFLFFSTVSSWIFSCVGILVNKNTCIIMGSLFFMGASAAAQITWTGNIDSDWQNNGNWAGGIIPTSSDNVTIPAAATTYPVITATSSVKDISIEAGASLTVDNNWLRIAGTISNSGIFDVSAGTIELNGIFSAQVIPANAFTNNTIMNLVISNNVSLEGTVILTGTLFFGSSNVEFATGDFLTLKSTAANTARINDITNDGADSGNLITGKITVERYFPLRKGWRLLGATVAATDAPTINGAWQEGVTTASTNSNPNPGYGVHITGGTTTHGFDQSITNSASVKVYNNTTNTFAGLPAIPGTDRPITDYPGYFVYIRGDRGIDPMQGTSAAVTPTTLRMKGAVNINLQARTVNATGLTILSNPYPSVINFQTLGRHNVNNSFYMWDPELSGNFGLGGYVAFSWNEGTLSYDATTSVSPLSQYIPAGEAIFIQSEDGATPGSIDINETDKNDGISRHNSNSLTGLSQQLRVNMYAVNTDSSVSLLDGVLTTYSDANNNGIDNHDAGKMFGSSESINIKRQTSFLAIERRATITDVDTTFLNIYHMSQKPYRLEIAALNLNTPGLMAFIADSYDNTINNTPLNLNGTTVINFNVNADPASYNVARFKIVFKMMSILPVTFETIKAYQHGNDIEVDWSTSSEININHYDVERAADGKNFSKINTTLATAINGGKVFYQVLDKEPIPADNYYRIRSVSNYGNELYSNIVKVNMKSVNDQPEIAVFPNPVISNTISFQLNNLKKGTYNLQLYNKLGAVVATKTIEHNAVNSSSMYELKSKLATGEYELKLTGANTMLSASVLKK